MKRWTILARTLASGFLCVTGFNGMVDAADPRSIFAPSDSTVVNRDRHVQLTAYDDAEVQLAPPSEPTEGDSFSTFEERLAELEKEIAASKKKAADDSKKKAEKEAADAKKPKKWYDKIGLRGYTQIRINEVFDKEDSLARPSHDGDSSIGDNQSFIIRRARFVFSGDVNDHLSLYFQPDFAVTPPGSPDSNHFTQLRDLYADVYLDKDREYRFRVGQSKVPYGWENLQSSQNRLPLDRSDSLNSAVRNERDLGVFFYYTPTEVQELFKHIMDSGLKHSGNYGMFGIGAYNGQGGSFSEQNDNLHVVSRLTLPFYVTDEQIAEVGIQGYIGEYTVLTSAISPLGVGPTITPLGGSASGGRDGHNDKRVAASFIYYPQPFGFQTEWTVGRGPSLDPSHTFITDRALYGGYAMIMYRLHEDEQELTPFARWNYYKGGYKSARNAPFSEINELEFGTEIQFSKSMELVTMYTITDRTNTRAISTAGRRSYDQFNGSILRFQFQFNY